MGKKKADRSRPKRPKGSPLTPHKTGKWRARIAGKDCYFGSWDNYAGAKAEYDRAVAAVTLGCHVANVAGEDKVSIEEVVNRWLIRQRARRDSGDIDGTTYRDDYLRESARILNILPSAAAAVSVGPADFAKLRDELSSGLGTKRVRKCMSVTRAIFAWAFEVGLIPSPVRFGPDFKPPSKGAERREKQGKPPKIVPADVCQSVLEYSDKTLSRYVTLAINCAFIAKDLSDLPRDLPDLERGVVVFPRTKTGIARVATLWPESIAAIQWYRDNRADAASPEDDYRLILSSNGKLIRHGNTNDPGRRFRAALDSLGLYEPGRSFSALRHSAKKAGSRARDPEALRYLMGHKESGVGEDYSHGIDVDRVRAVTDAIRAWLWPDRSTGG